MNLSIQPSTTRNLLAIAGEGKYALMYGTDIADLLANDGTDMVGIDEADLFAAATGAALIIAARRLERSVSIDTTGAITIAAEQIAEALTALRVDRTSGHDLAVLRETIAAAIVFQFTDPSEQE